ncbi:MAG: PDDEXK nuclease domain-containing protein [Candidatus Dependentiae bacterium]|nr:PDDEXK nuclease domain-containing protein [Candidatus Dependentiae bacterium]
MNKKISTKKTLLKKEVASVKEYISTLAMIKQQIKEAQVRATFSVNRELLKLYWSIGKVIVAQQQKNGWGSHVIEKLAEDLQNSFPGMSGFSKVNIFRMKAFYAAYEIVSQAVTQLDDFAIFNIPWGHNVVLLFKLKDDKQRLWYAQKTIEYGWSRSMLETWIKSDLYKREGKAITNFSKTLPASHSDMAQQSFKDPYIFDFLTLHAEHMERDLEQGLIEHVQKLLLEMGKGFALIGRQYHLEVDGDDYYIDLLFYHVKLKCYVVVELKARAFDPRDVGQLNFYLSAIDDLIRDEHDKPTIGLILCKTKKNFTAEYALRDIKKPIGIAEYETAIIKKLPKELKSSLPTIEEIEAEFEKYEAAVPKVLKSKKR